MSVAEGYRDSRRQIEPVDDVLLPAVLLIGHGFEWILPFSQPKPHGLSSAFRPE